MDVLVYDKCGTFRVVRNALTDLTWRRIYQQNRPIHEFSIPRQLLDEQREVRASCLPDGTKFAEEIKELFCSDVVAVREHFISRANLGEYLGTRIDAGITGA